MARRLTRSELAEARRIITDQANTAPADGDLSPEGAWRRASGVVTVGGRRAHERIDRPTGFPAITEVQEAA